jgi:hypothetical protein
MTQHTENYLILKPIAERFNRVASEITDDDIKYIIKSLMKQKIEEAIDFSSVSDYLCSGYAINSAKAWCGRNTKCCNYSGYDSYFCNLNW